MGEAKGKDKEMKTFKEISQGLKTRYYRKAVATNRHGNTQMKVDTARIFGKPGDAKKAQDRADSVRSKMATVRPAGEAKEDSDAVKAFLAKGGKITKVPAAKAQGYHGKDDPGKGMHGILDKPDTQKIGTRKKVKSMEGVDEELQVYRVGHKSVSGNVHAKSHDDAMAKLRAKGVKGKITLTHRGSASKAIPSHSKTGKPMAAANESYLGHSDAEKLGKSRDSNFDSAASHIDHHLRRHPDASSASGGQRDQLRHKVAKGLGYSVESTDVKELSTPTLKSYLKKAGPQKDKYYSQYQKLRRGQTKKHGEFSPDMGKTKEVGRKAVNRDDGEYRAQKTLAKRGK